MDIDFQAAFKLGGGGGVYVERSPSAVPISCQLRKLGVIEKLTRSCLGCTCLRQPKLQFPNRSLLGKRHMRH